MFTTSFDELAVAAGTRLPLLILVLKATLILLGAIAATALLRRASAGARHLVWLVTLAALLLVPALASWSPIGVPILSPSAPATNGFRADTEPGITLDAVAAAPVAAAPPASPPTAAPAAASSGWAVAWGTGVFTLVGLWAIVALGILTSLGFAAFTVRRIVRASAALDTADWRDPLYEVSDRLGLDQPPRLLRSSEAPMPFACGVWKPAIVLPAASDHWTLERRRAVLLHELAHVRRRDLVGHTIAHIACALYWFHPLVWSGARRLRAESERACDDIALACGAKASDYAEHLLDIVTSVKSERTPSLALAMARRKEFEGRMLSILDPELRRTMPSRRRVVALAGSFAMFVLLIGAASPTPREAAAAADLSMSQVDVGSDFDSAADPHRDVVLPVSGQPELPDAPPRMQAPLAPPVSAAASVSGSLHAEAAAVAQAAVSESVSAAVRSAVDPITTRVVRSVVPSILQSIVGSRAGAAAVPDTERAEMLAKILETDSSARVRRIAAWGLQEHPRSPQGVAALTRALRADRSAEVREMSAWALAEGVRTQSTTSALAAALANDDDPRVRATAAWALGELEARSELGALVRAFGDASGEVRRAAIWAVGSAEPRQAPAELVRMLEHPDQQSRVLAAWALYSIEDPATVAPLQRALRAERDADVQRAYIRALMALGEHSVDAIREMLDSPDPEIKQMAVRSLARSEGMNIWPWPWPMPRPFP